MNQNQFTSAEPSLKVMRLQSPELGMSSTSSAYNTSGGGCDSGISSSSVSSIMSNSLILPDSFGLIHIGETFTAYLGVINIHSTESVTNLSVSATLQTPTRRWSLPNPLEDKRISLSPSNKTTSSNNIDLSNAQEENLDFDNEIGINIPPLGGLDAIVSRFLEEVGQHILRVEVSYGGPILSKQQQQQQQQQIYTQQSVGTSDLLANRIAPPLRRSIRKFYRFHVSSPLNIQDITLRCGESSCFVSLTVENTAPPSSSTGVARGISNTPTASTAAGTITGSFLGGALTIFQAEFQPFPGLIAQRIHTSALSCLSSCAASGSKKVKSAVELYDECGRLGPGESYRFLFHVQASSREATARCIAKGDELGKVVITWRKAMGEVGRIASTFVYCPTSELELNSLSSSTLSKESSLGNIDTKKIQKENIVVHGSGFSADVSSSAAQKSTSTHHHAPSEISSVQTIDDFYPITVEPVNPPNTMGMGKPMNVQLLIVNHTSKTKSNLQLQMRLIQMKGVVIYGHAFQNLDVLQPNGGSVVVDVKLLGMVPGLFHVGGCVIVDLNSGMEVEQPKLFSVYVNDKEQ